MEAKPYKIPHPFRKLNKELIDNIVKDIAEGSTHRLAAESNNVTKRIVEIWRNQGEIDIEHDVDSLCAYLVRSLGKIKQNEVKKCRKLISSRIKSHKGAEWTLEHAYARDFSARDAIDEINEEIERLKKDLYGENHHGDIESSEKE